MKRGLLILPFTVLTLSALGGCDSDDGSSSTSPIDSSTKDDEHIDLIPESRFPDTLVLDGVEYELYEGYGSGTMPASEVTDFFGYWINAEDLEKWQEYDGDEDIVYVIQEDNSLYHVDSSGELSDRFDLYWTVNEGQIAVREFYDEPGMYWDMYWPYQRASDDSAS